MAAKGLLNHSEDFSHAASCALVSHVPVSGAWRLARAARLGLTPTIARRLPMILRGQSRGRKH